MEGSPGRQASITSPMPHIVCRSLFSSLSTKNTKLRGNCASSDKIRASLQRCRYASDRLVEETDVLVIGSGVGGLACGGLLAKSGVQVSVLEAYSIPGGCAHGWSRGDFHFDSGTSLFFGISTRDLENPLAAVLAILEEDVEMHVYDHSKTRLFFNNAMYDTQIGSTEFASVIEDLWGHEASRQWTQLQDLCQEYGSTAASIHPMAVRYDNWIGLTAVARSPVKFLKFLTDSSGVASASFSNIVDQVVSCEEVRRFVNILGQGTSGLSSDDILASYMIRAFNRLYQRDSKWEIPHGGSQSIVDALVRGLRKHGGKLHLRARVDRILVENERAVGIQLANGKCIRARKAVVSNATVWDTARLIPSKALSSDFRDYVMEMEMNESFMHLHLAFDKKGLPDMPLHTFFFDDSLVGDSGWPTICIPTSVDTSLAPPDKHVLHVYIAEPYDRWAGLDTKSDEYTKLKEESCKTLWQLVKKVIPDIEERVELQLSGSPLTHERFLNRMQGTYGSKNLLKVKTTPSGIQPLKNVYCVGDSTFPGTGTPAVAASGMWVANSLLPIHKHWRLLDELNV